MPKCDDMDLWDVAHTLRPQGLGFGVTLTECQARMLVKMTALVESPYHPLPRCHPNWAPSSDEDEDADAEPMLKVIELTPIECQARMVDSSNQAPSSDEVDTAMRLMLFADFSASKKKKPIFGATWSLFLQLKCQDAEPIPKVVEPSLMEHHTMTVDKIRASSSDEVGTAMRPVVFPYFSLLPDGLL